MPFALNESTEFISPTKTLEYMAAGKPVVSTPMHDVKAMFGDIVAIAADADGFVAACRAALAETAPQKAAREQRMRERVGKHSWDAAAETIRRSLEVVLAAAPRPGGATAVRQEGVAGIVAPSTDEALAPPQAKAGGARKVASVG